ncbi:MAG: hypothetical protein WAX77_01635 [Methylococcaceae bacterium]
MSAQTLSLEEWLTVIEEKIENNQLKQANSIKLQLTALITNENKALLCQALYKRGWSAFNNKHFSIAELLFSWLAELDSKNWQVHLANAMLKQQLNNQAQAIQQFRGFVSENPIYSYQLSTNPQAIKIAVLVTLGSELIRFNKGGFSIANGLTDIEHLLKSSNYSVALLFVEGIVAKDLDAFDCIINAVSDSDLYYQQMLQLQNILKTCTKPIINHPKYSILTTRDYISQYTPLTAGIIIPKLIRVTLKDDSANTLNDAIEQHALRYPLLIRSAGTQNGTHFILLKDKQDSDNYHAISGDYYLSEYYDFKSQDGFYRKYRCWSIGNTITLTHSLFSEHWNVHSSSRMATMSKHPWMAKEEQQFINGDFLEKNSKINTLISALKQSAQLDCFGVDFAFMNTGEILLFEANATMLSSIPAERVTLFPYLQDMLNYHKHAFAELIKQKITAL